MSIDFVDIQSFLISIRSRLQPDCIASISWDGKNLKVTAAKPSSELRPWVMTFDSEDDFDIDPELLIKQFTDGAKAYFGTGPEQADYLNGLMRQAEAK